MVILELAVQGVRGLAPTVRIALKQGYTLLQAQTPGASLFKLFEALCYADARDEAAAALLAPGAAQARAGLTFQGRDGQTYRLVRELGASGTLAQMDAATGKFLPITSDAAEVAQYLRSSCGLPTRSAYEQVFAIVDGRWPSQQPAAAAPGLSKKPHLTPGPMPALASMHARAAVQPSANVEATRAQIADLRVELDGVREADELQFKLDGVQKRVFDAGAKLRELEGLQREIGSAEASVEASPSPAKLGLPANVGERAARFEQLEKSRDDQLRRLEAEREQFLGRAVQPEPLQKQVPFLVSAGLGVFTLAVGLALGHAWRYFSLLDIPAFGMAAVFALRHVGELQSGESVGRRQSHYDDRQKSIEATFENEVLSVKTAMKVLGVGTAGELIDVIAQRQMLEHNLGEARKRLEALQNDPEVAAAQRDAGDAQAEQAALETRMGELSSFTRPPHVVEGEIEELEASIAAARNPQPAATVAPAAAAAAVATSPAAELSAEDPIPRLLDLTTDLFATDRATLAGLVAPRAGQYLAALTERRLSAVELDGHGQAQVTTAEGKRAAGLLPGKDRDLLYLAVKVALMERYAERAKLPVLIDDAFSQFAPSEVALIGRMLKHLGTRAQVLHLTASTATEAFADTRAAV
jgi:hypothetical protein